jgi:hypothetical protein
VRVNDVCAAVAFSRVGKWVQISWRSCGTVTEFLTSFCQFSGIVGRRVVYVAARSEQSDTARICDKVDTMPNCVVMVCCFAGKGNGGMIERRGIGATNLLIDSSLNQLCLCLLHYIEDGLTNLFDS